MVMSDISSHKISGTNYILANIINSANSFPILIDTRNGSVKKLDSNMLFPVNVHGDSQPVSFDGKNAILIPSYKSSSCAKIININSRQTIKEIPSMDMILGSCIRWKNDNTLIWLDKNGVLHDSDKQEKLYDNMTYHPTSAVLSPDASKLVTSSKTNNILQLKFIDTETKFVKDLKIELRKGENVSVIKWSPDCSNIAVSLDDNAHDWSGRLLVISKEKNVTFYSKKGSRIIGLNDTISWSSNSKKLAIVLYPNDSDESNGFVGLLDIN